VADPGADQRVYEETDRGKHTSRALAGARSSLRRCQSSAMATADRLTIGGSFTVALDRHFAAHPPASFVIKMSRSKVGTALSIHLSTVDRDFGARRQVL